MAPTKANVAEGEFAGVELTFMGLNNQNLHNFLFRGFLKPWEAYTGAKINWIDLAQADYNARLQQSIATGTVDFDIIEMGAPFEGDTAGKGLLDEMPDWVKTQIDMDDYVGYLKAPVGTWDGKTYRITIDGDCHTFAYRKDYFGDGAIIGGAEVPEDLAAGQRGVQGAEGPDRPADRPATPMAILDPLKGWGGFGFYFLEDRATAYVKHPDDPAWLFDPDTMKPRVNNPGWVQAIQDVMDLIAAGAYPADQINADPGTTAFSPVPGRHRFDADAGGATWARTPAPPTPRSWATWWASRSTPARTSVYNSDDRRLGRHRATKLRAEHGLYRLGRLRHQPRLGRREEAQGGMVRRGPSGRQGHLAVDGGLSVGLPALPQLALQL